MILICSKGHQYDTETNIWHKDKYVGQTCNMLMSYDRLAGSIYCGAKLFDLNKKIEQLHDQAYTRYYNGNDKIFESEWNIEEVPRTLYGVKPSNFDIRLRELLLQGKTVKTGYTCCKIRGVHQHKIFYK